MTSRNSPRQSLTVWCWQRRVNSEKTEEWIVRLQGLCGAAWSVAQKPQHLQALLSAYPTSHRQGLSWVRALGGSLKRIEQLPKAGLGKLRTRINSRLEIIHDISRRTSTARELCLPHGLAFGSGEHATTTMLLREMSLRSTFAGHHVLDLGTGSGILALLARKLGARRVVATDFDPAAIRTSQGNELLNFSDSRITWRVADARRLRAQRRYHLVLANLFSGILVEAAACIAAAVMPEGELWLSGILKAQGAAVEIAYGNEGLKLTSRKSLGKWIMLQFRKPVAR